MGAFNEYKSTGEQLKAYLDWVYAAVSLIAQDAATVDLRLYVNRSGARNAQLLQRMVHHPKEVKHLLKRTVPRSVIRNGVETVVQLKALEEIESHQLLDLLYNPNPFMTKNEFLELTYQHLKLAGNSYWAVIRNGQGMPTQLWPIMPDRVEVVPDKENFIKGYAVSVGRGTKVPFEPDDIIHHRYMDPNSLYYGMGIVRAAARAIDTDSRAADYSRKFFINSARPDGVLETDKTLDTTVFDRLKANWYDTYGSADNAHKVAVLEAGLQYKQINTTQKDMEYLEGRKFTRDQILGMFRMSKAMLGILEDANRANMEAAEYNYSKRIIKPDNTRLVDRITQDLAPQFDPKLIVGFTDPVPEDREYLLKEKKTATNTWRTVNETREEEGRDPIDGGDVLPAQQQAQQIEMVQEMYRAMPLLAQAVANVATGIQQVKKLAVPPAPPEKKKLYSTADERTEIGEAWTATIRQTATDHEGRFMRQTRNEFDREITEVLANLRQHYDKGMPIAKTKDLLDDLVFDTEEAIKRLIAAFGPIYYDVVKEAGTAAYILIGMEGFNMADPNVTKYFDKRPKKVSTEVTRETEKQLRATLTEGINSGESMSQLTARVEQTMGAPAGFRAERIARTETIHATNWASDQAWQQSGVVEKKEWYTAKDEVVCPFCNSMDGKKVGIGKLYYEKGDSLQVIDDNGKTQTIGFKFDSIQGPPLHVNCRCSLLPVLIAD